LEYVQLRQIEDDLRLQISSLNDSNANLRSSLFTHNESDRKEVMSL
jgi:hypothetical protein